MPPKAEIKRVRVTIFLLPHHLTALQDWAGGFMPLGGAVEELLDHYHRLDHYPDLRTIAPSIRLRGAPNTPTTPEAGACCTSMDL